MSVFVVDIETDGPAPGRNSMVWFGAVHLDEALTTTFEGKVCPMSDLYLPEALAVSHLTREETLLFPKPEVVIPRFVSWVKAHNRSGSPQLWSDNNGYDAGFLNYYLWHFAGENPFGHSSRNISDRYKGLIEARLAAGLPVSKRERRSFKHLRKTVHDHNPVNDAIGNAEALLAMRQLGLKVPV